MSEHTLGPWTAGRLDMDSYASDGSPVHFVYRPSDDGRTRIAVKGENCAHDAILIAAAPDLLRVAELLVALCDTARAAIAKAEGRT
jgi:hypothetical protein